MTVLYLNWISRGNTRGTGTGTIDRSSTISAPTGREGSDAVTENSKKKKKQKKREKGRQKEKEKWTRGIEGRRARAERAASTTGTKEGGKGCKRDRARDVFREENIAAR